MPTHILARVSAPVITNAPKDRIVISPCFRHQSLLVEGGPEWQQLADDLATAIQGYSALASGEFQVKLYDLAGAVPNYPKATKTLNPGVVHNPAVPGQLAVCLSFYGTQNIPRDRGRLYLPLWMLGGTTPAYITSTVMTKALALAPILSGLGGVNVDWIVWSRAGNKATKVQNVWCDDQWDIQRRRKYQRAAAIQRATTGG